MTLAQEIAQVSKLEGKFKLRSGKYSTEYFDKYNFEANPNLLDKITTALIPLIPPKTEVLAGLEMGGIPIATLLSHKTKIPTAFIRKTPKKYGTCQFAEGESLKNKTVVIIEDIVSSGGAIIEAVKKMRQEKIKINL